MKLNYPEIKNWSLFDSLNFLGLESYIDPKSIFEHIHIHISGMGYNSSKFPDGRHIFTSTVQRFICEQGVIIAETKNSKYIIRKETIDEKYENQFRNVWEKLIKNIEG